MRRMVAVVLILLFSSFACRSTQRQAAAEGKPKEVAASAVWNPDKTFRERVVERCSDPKVKDFGECFIAVMTASKASPQAVAFARSIGNTGYLRAFRETGVVDIASVAYPFRANENYGCLLVNGDPAVVDPDDYGIMSKLDLSRDVRYREIASAFPKADLWPGDRWGSDCIIPGVRSDGAQRFLVAYRLLNGCHACEVLASVKVAFDFDTSGKITSTELVGVDSVVKIFSDPEKPVTVSMGSKFVIVLEANITTGYRWIRADAGNSSVVKYVGTEYLEPAKGLVGAPGKDVLTFEAAGKGTAEISLKYVRPWEKDVPPARTVIFKVGVE